MSRRALHLFLAFPRPCLPRASWCFSSLPDAKQGLEIKKRKQEVESTRTSLLDFSPPAAAATTTLTGIEWRLSLCPPFTGRREWLTGIAEGAVAALAPRRAAVGLGNIAKTKEKKKKLFVDRICNVELTFFLQMFQRSDEDSIDFPPLLTARNSLSPECSFRRRSRPDLGR